MAERAGAMEAVLGIYSNCGSSVGPWKAAPDDKAAPSEATELPYLGGTRQSMHPAGVQRVVESSSIPTVTRATHYQQL